MSRYDTDVTVQIYTTTFVSGVGLHHDMDVAVYSYTTTRMS